MTEHALSKSVDETIALAGCSRPEEGRACSVCVAAAEVHVKAVEAGGMVVVPVAAHAWLVRVARYVSAGRRYVDVEPYPDATARLALGALPERSEDA